MKPIKLRKKLTLGKKTVANLTHGEMTHVNAGYVPTDEENSLIVTGCDPCVAPMPTSWCISRAICPSVDACLSWNNQDCPPTAEITETDCGLQCP